MNFNFFVLFILFSLTSCGLKKYPKGPVNNTLPSITDHYKVIYENNPPLENEDEEKKNEQKKSN